MIKPHDKYMKLTAGFEYNIFFQKSKNRIDQNLSQVTKPKAIDISNILDVVNGGGIGGGAFGGGGGGGGGGGSVGGEGGSSGTGGSGQNQTVPKRSAAEVAQLASLVAYSLNNAGSGNDNKNTSEEDLKKAEEVSSNFNTFNIIVLCNQRWSCVRLRLDDSWRTKVALVTMVNYMYVRNNISPWLCFISYNES